MKKEVKIDSERKLIIESDEDNLKKEVKEVFSVDGMECAHYSIIMDNNFCFKSSLDLDFTEEENKHELLFQVDYNHPLYFPFLNILGKNNEITIYDDKTTNKYLNIKNNDDIIELRFVDRTDIKDLNNKFVINCDKKYHFLNRKDTNIDNKIIRKIYHFFNETDKILQEDYHQINFDEYSITEKILNKKKIS